MQTLLSVIFFIAGVILVVKGGDWFVDAASWIAKAAKIPTFIIGATIVSFATTLPEMIVSIMASLEGKNDMAVGNAIGSVTANTGLIMAIAFLFMFISAPRKRFIKQYSLLVAATAILWIGSLTGNVQMWACILLIIVFCLSLILNVLDVRNSPEDKNEIEEFEDAEETKEANLGGKNVAVNIIIFIIGAAAIVLGSNLLIKGGSDIASLLGVPERVIAVTMVAIGTSLPELVTTLTAIKKREAHMSIGNVIGANIIDVSLILPLCSLISGGSFQVSSQCLKLDFPACFIITLIAIVPLALKERSYKAQGIIMLAAYCGYLTISI